MLIGAVNACPIHDLQACSALGVGLPAGLAMVQYKPDGPVGCYPAADLAGTTLAYTASGNSTRAWTSVTVHFSF